MKKNFPYRPLTALLLAALVLQVFALQGLHHVLGHHHEEPACDLKTSHVHAKEHGHFSCELCLFHFAPTDLQAEDLTIQPRDVGFVKSCFTYHDFQFAQSLRQSYLRGPPTATV